MSKPYKYKIELTETHSITDVIVRLEKLSNELRASEAANVLPFNNVYIVITKKLKEAIQQKVFNEPSKLEKLDVHFADSYFQALNKYAVDKKMTPAWQPLLTPNLPSFIYALLGANIHIGYDL